MMLSKKKCMSTKSFYDAEIAIREIATHNPEIIGPKTGPRNTLAVNKLVAGPLPAEDQMSAITPPQFVSGATAKKPDKKRVTRRV